MMKRIVCSIVMILVSLTVVLFAQSGSWQVLSVAGRVERQLQSGIWEPVTKGMSLSSKDTVTTGLNSILIVKTGDRTVVIDSLKKGSIEELSVASSSGQKGIRSGRSAVTSDAAVKTGPDRTNISTASTRAEMRSDEIEWDDEDTGN